MYRRYKFLVKEKDDSGLGGYRIRKIWMSGNRWKHAKQKAENYVAKLNREQRGTDRTHYELITRASQRKPANRKNWLQRLMKKLASFFS